MPEDLRAFKAVTFEFRPGQFRTIAYLEQLVAYLNQEWPAEAGAHCKEARSACAAARDGKIDVEQARQKFVAALAEIGVTAI